MQPFRIPHIFVETPAAVPAHEILPFFFACVESTKQLLELEVRSKQLLDKTNKKLQTEIEQVSGGVVPVSGKIP